MIPAKTGNMMASEGERPSTIGSGSISSPSSSSIFVFFGAGAEGGRRSEA